MDEVIDEALVDDFDKMATVVDWLDCCRSKNVNALLDFYADNATLECGCAGACVSGRSALAAYWEPRLSAASPAAFGLQEITPEGEGVVLDYLGFEGKPVRITFAFDRRGRISHTRCGPVPR
jgi:SnoaL-like domain